MLGPAERQPPGPDGQEVEIGRGSARAAIDRECDRPRRRIGIVARIGDIAVSPPAARPAGSVSVRWPAVAVKASVRPGSSRVWRVTDSAAAPERPAPRAQACRASCCCPACSRPLLLLLRMGAERRRQRGQQKGRRRRRRRSARSHREDPCGFAGNWKSRHPAATFDAMTIPCSHAMQARLTPCAATARRSSCCQ